MPPSAPVRFTLYPLFRLAVCLAGGIAAANFLGFDWRVYFAAGVAAGLASAILMRRGAVSIFLLAAAFFAVGGLYFEIENQKPPPNRLREIYDRRMIASGDPVEIEGVLQTVPELAVGGFFIRLKSEKIVYKNSETIVSGTIRLFAAAPNETTRAEYETLDLRYGSRVRVACALRRDENFANAGAVSRVAMLDDKRIDATGTIKSPLLVERVGDAPTFAPLGWIYERRRNLIVEFRRYFSVSTSGVLIASLLGNARFLDQPTAEAFRAGGTFHVLVISGLHITFIGALTLLVTRLFTRRRFAQFVIAAGLLWAYSIAVGAETPVVRAALMFTTLLFSHTIRRDGTLLNALGACALLLLIWRPNDVFTESFQLTFASVLAIVAVAFPLVEKLRAVGSWSPTVETPFPPRVPVWLKRFCETIYWREAVWESENTRRLWTARLFKSTHLRWLKSRNRQTFARYVFEALVVSLVVQACLLPLLVVYFHRFTPLAAFANLWVGAVIALESFAAVFAVALAQISETLALPLVKLTEALNWLLVHVPEFFNDYAWANVRVPTYSGAGGAIYVLYFVPVVYLSFALHRWQPFALKSAVESRTDFFNFARARAAFFGWLVCAALIVFHPYSEPPVDGRLHVEFLDVGQGDAAFIRFPNGETLLVDGGGRRNFDQMTVRNDSGAAEIFEPDAPDIGETVVSRFLWERGFSRIDYVLATHADADHIQGLAAVAENFSARAALVGSAPAENPEFRRFAAVLQKRGIESAIVRRGDVLSFGAATVEVLHPPRGDSAPTVADNDESIVLRIVLGERKFLLTGDIERHAETELLNAPGFLRADVVKVAHHGSRTSSAPEFVSAARAGVAVVPVGLDSPYGHPHPEVVERWKAAGARVLTTGENGTVSFSTDGRDLHLKTFKGAPVYR